MNCFYVSTAFSLNVGTGKTLSAIEKLVYEHLVLEKKIFSNIKLTNIDYTPFYPSTLSDVLDCNNAVVLFDELSAVLYKNHRIHESCGKHSVKGLCYHLTQFFRQVRKKDITTISTGQVFADAQVQLRQLMHEVILCKKFHFEGLRLVECQTDKCPSWHGEHVIQQKNQRTGGEVYKYLDIYHDFYDSSEIVAGWV